MSKLELVRAKIIEAVPDIELGDYLNSAIEQRLFREITLADVLMAIGKIHGGSVLKVNSIGGFTHFGGEDGEKEWKDIALPRWNLALPLDKQKEEVIDFLGEILGVESSTVEK